MARKRKKRKLFGAALRSYRKANPRKRRKSRRRKNRGRRSFASRMSMFKMNPRKRRKRRNNPKAKKSSIRRKKIAAAYMSGASAYAAGIAKFQKKQKKRKKSKKSKTSKKGKSRKSSKRSAAAKKAARTRKRNKLKRQKAAKKAARARKRKGGAKKGKAMAKRKHRKSSRRRRKFRGPFSKPVMKARRAIRRGRSRKYGSRRSRRTVRFFKMRTNPGKIIGMLKSAVKIAAPIAVGFVGTKMVLNKVGGLVLSKIPGVGALGRHTGPLMSVAGLFLAHFACNKVSALGKHRAGIVTGAALNFLQTVWSEYVPSSIKGMIGMGDVYEQALAGYSQDMADYVETGDYVEMGEYVEGIGAEEDLAGDMVGPVGSMKMLGPVGHKATIGPVPDWTPEWSQDGLYTGLFGKKML